MSLWFEYAFAVVGVDLVVSLEWYASAGAPSPILTEELRFVLTDRSVTPEMIYQRVRDRATEVKQGLSLYQAVMARFGGGQNTRIEAP